MRIIFMGTPDFAEKSLEALYNANHEILAVVTNPDKPKGRGMKIVSSPVKEFAQEKNLPVHQPIKVKNNPDFINEIRLLKPDLLCVVAYGKILPQEILDIPKYGSINVHGSLLPKYRGAAPIQWAVLNGDKETGVTTMFMDAGMDTGDMILKETVKIGENETTGELWNRLSVVGAELLVKTINKIEEAVKKCEDKDVLSIRKMVGAKKQGDNYTVAPMLNREMAKIDWNKTADEIHNLVRGLNPIIGAYTYLDNKKLKIWKTKKATDISINKKCLNGEVALVDKKQLIIKTGDGLIEILEIQPENKKKMTVKEFLNGANILKRRTTKIKNKRRY